MNKIVFPDVDFSTVTKEQLSGLKKAFKGLETAFIEKSNVFGRCFICIDIRKYCNDEIDDLWVDLYTSAISKDYPGFGKGEPVDSWLYNIVNNNKEWVSEDEYGNSIDSPQSRLQTQMKVGLTDFTGDPNSLRYEDVYDLAMDGNNKYRLLWIQHMLKCIDVIDIRFGG